MTFRVAFLSTALTLHFFSCKDSEKSDVPSTKKQCDTTRAQALSAAVVAPSLVVFFFPFDPFYFGLCFVLRGRKTSLFRLRSQMLVGVSGFFGPALICISANLWNGLARLF